MKILERVPFILKGFLLKSDVNNNKKMFIKLTKWSSANIVLVRNKNHKLHIFEYLKKYETANKIC